jgi:hypothetical protein
VIKVEAFYFKGFGNWIVEVGADRWAVMMAVEGLEVNERGYSLVKAATVFQPEWLLGR